MSDILDTIASYAEQRVEEARRKVPLAVLKEQARCMGRETGFPFEKALSRKDVSFICEVKRASPSKGLIDPDFPYLDIAREYEAAGAAAISVLTEPKWFMGSDRYLKEISSQVSIPCLRKDFVVDEYMIYEAKVLGASAVLLICSILDEERLRYYIKTADSLGLSALVEVGCGARVIGVNNRNLRDFTVDVGNSVMLRRLVPPDILFVGESGISGPEDVESLRRADVDSALVGESMMRAEDKKEMLRFLRGYR